MLQYLLNATAIWVLSLVLFDVFLQKETYHSYNRGYLLFTFLLGVFLPLWQWQDKTGNYPVALQQPLQRVMVAKQNIVTASAPHSAFDWVQLLYIIYLLGAGIAVCLVIIDIGKLIAFYRISNKSKEGIWTIIETGKEHTPFSFRNTLFVCSRLQYTNEEWNMILTHEARHHTLFHFADILLMQAARIVFWFHPLVYLHSKRLLLVHEYQADNTSASQPQQYGRFLLEQAMLPSAPSLSHSFNCSPIKNRIVMLTRKSSSVSRGKMLLFLPLLIVCILCFSKNSFSQKFEKKGNGVICEGNTLEMSVPKLDTIILTDPVTGGDMVRYVQNDPTPLKMNGKEIQDIYPDDHLPAAIANSTEQYFKYLMDNLRPLLERLNDGIYCITPDDAIVNEKGKLAYYRSTGIAYYVSTGTMNEEQKKNARIEPQLQESINKKTFYLLEHCPNFAILDIKGTNMPYRFDHLTVTVKNHQLNAL